MTGKQASSDGEPAKRTTIPVLHEVAQIDIRDVDIGRVRVMTHTTPIEELAHAELHGEAIDVTRVAVNQPVVGAVPEIRTEGDLTIVPVLEEVLVVEKRLMLKEELHIRRRATTEAITVPVTLRQQSAHVEHFDVDGDRSTLHE